MSEWSNLGSIRRAYEEELFKFIESSPNFTLNERTLIFSDVHANYRALRAALDFSEKNSVSRLISLGDMVDYNTNPDLTVSTILDHPGLIYAVRGNHDCFEEFISPKVYVSCYAKSKINPELALRINELPTKAIIGIQKKKFLLCHSNPWEDDGLYVYPSNVSIFDDILFRMPCQGFFYGHTHFVADYSKFGKVIFNPGSLGQSRGDANRLTFAWIDPDMLSIEIFGMWHNPVQCEEIISAPEKLSEIRWNFN